MSGVVNEAELYDWYNAFALRRQNEDIRLYKSLWASTGSPVIDLGCGTGRVTIPLAQAGAEAVGLDASTDRIRLAQTKAAEAGVANVRFEVADMRDFELGLEGGLILIAYSSFQLLPSAADRLACLRACHSNLRQDGLLAIDISQNFVNHEETEREHVRTAWMDRAEAPVVLYGSTKQVLDEGYTEFVDEFSILAGCRSETTIHVRERYYHLAEDDILRLAAEAGLQQRAIYHDYRMGPPDLGYGKNIHLLAPAADR